MSVDATPLVLRRRRGVLPLLNLVEVGERLHIYSVICCVDVCYKAKCSTIALQFRNCIAIASQFRNFSKIETQFPHLHVKLHFFVSPFVPSPFGPPPQKGVSWGRLGVSYAHLPQ